MQEEEKDKDEDEDEDEENNPVLNTKRKARTEILDPPSLRQRNHSNPSRDEEHAAYLKQMKLGPKEEDSDYRDDNNARPHDRLRIRGIGSRLKGSHEKVVIPERDKGEPTEHPVRRPRHREAITAVPRVPEEQQGGSKKEIEIEDS